MAINEPILCNMSLIMTLLVNQLLYGYSFGGGGGRRKVGMTFVSAIIPTLVYMLCGIAIPTSWNNLLYLVLYTCVPHFFYPFYGYTSFPEYEDWCTGSLVLGK